MDEPKKPADVEYGPLSVVYPETRFVLADETNSTLVASAEGPAKVKSGEAFTLILPKITLE